MDTTTLTLVMIPLDELRPNEFNPNRQTDEEFRQNVEEVRRLNGLPKPIVVRQTKAGLEIVDGEYGWRTAKEAGLTEVPCVIIDADKFEAMRQCYKRNHHGRDSRVKRGKMFLQMMEERGLSERALAKEMDISAGTISNDLDYLKALELRNSCAGDDHEEEIDKLSIRQVHQYLELPAEIRDTWLDAGGDMAAFNGSDVSGLLKPIIESGLANTVTPTKKEFRRSLKYASELAQWRGEHADLNGVDEYLQPLAHLRLPARLLNCLPYQNVDGVARVVLPPETWADILQEAVDKICDDEGILLVDRTSDNAFNGKSLLPYVQAAIHVALRKVGIDPGDCFGPYVALGLEIVADGPDFIREATFLNLGEQLALVHAEADVPKEIVSQAKRMTVGHFKQQRTGEILGDPVPELKTIPSGASVENVFEFCVAVLVHREHTAEAVRLLADRDRLLDVVLGVLAQSEAVHAGVVGDRPAREVLAERLKSLAPPEFVLLAATLLTGHSVDIAAHQWLVTTNGNIPTVESTE